MTWISELVDAVASDCALDADRYALDERDVETLLDLAGLAAHRSGARTNAPLLCHVLGLMRGDGVDLDVLARAVRARAVDAG